MSNGVVVLNEKNFGSEVLNNQKPVLVDFYADWCGPCRMTGPIVEQIAQEYEGKATIAKLDVDSNNQLAAQYRVMSIPTMIFFKDGKEVERMVGVRPKAEFARILDGIIDK